jgi:hypothetical protein
MVNRPPTSSPLLSHNPSLHRVLVASASNYGRPIARDQPCPVALFPVAPSYSSSLSYASPISPLLPVSAHLSAACRIANGASIVHGVQMRVSRQ